MGSHLSSFLRFLAYQLPFDLIAGKGPSITHPMYCMKGVAEGGSYPTGEEEGADGYSGRVSGVFS